MKALVLGGTGFLGSWIVDELVRRNIETTIFARSMKNMQWGRGVRFVCGDFSDLASLRGAMRGCDAVFHVGVYYPMFSVDRARQAKRALAELRSVLRVAEKSSIGKFVFTSSPMVLVDDPIAFQESTYHDIKRLLHVEFTRWVEGGLPGITVIPGACFGPGDRKPTTGRLILEIAARRLRFVLEGRMNAVDVRDVARGQVETLFKGKVGSCYQLGNWNCTLHQFVEATARTCRISVPALRLYYSPIRGIVIASEWIQYLMGISKPLVPASGLDQIHFGTFLDSTSSREDLGFTSRPISTTIRETIDWFVENGYLHRGFAETEGWEVPA
jgi:dihydroflavonol-4-reductase